MLSFEAAYLTVSFTVFMVFCLSVCLSKLLSTCLSSLLPVSVPLPTFFPKSLSTSHIVYPLLFCLYLITYLFCLFCLFASCACLCHHATVRQPVCFPLHFHLIHYLCFSDCLHIPLSLCMFLSTVKPSFKST